MRVSRDVTDSKTGEVTTEWVDIPDLRTAAEQAVIDQQASAAAQILATNDGTIRQQAQAAMSGLRQVRDAASLDGAQQAAFNRLAARVLILLLRLALGRFEGTS